MRFPPMEVYGMSRIHGRAPLTDNDATQGRAMNSIQTQASILAVDDDTRSLMALQGLLADMSLRVVTAKSGDEALRCVLKQDFAVILMDARMPGVDGFEAARLIRDRERSRHTPIIFLTSAYEDAPSVTRGYEAGAVDYIVKPLRPEVLKSKISAQQSLRALASHLQSVREEEWTRIAREIHDHLAQALTGLKMDLAWITSRLPKGSSALRAKAQSMSGLIDSTMESMHEIMSQLRPEVLDRLGLAAAIGWQAGEFQRRSGIRCNVSLPQEELPVDRDRSTAVFRILQELLTNVVRHAGATRVDVALRSESNELLLTVADNGRGIDEEAANSPKSFGLMGVRERVLPFGGRVEISGVRAKGTTVTVALPAAAATQPVAAATQVEPGAKES
ncbi:MAG: response regulator [Gammaproteobacteria bacterium]|nr:MAG: response regulator [Gammaproteobacteria bacterium]